MGELVATLALAQDNAFGQPLESQLRSCLLAQWFGQAAGYDRDMVENLYWVALMRYIGCTGHAHEVAAVFGDEIAIRARTLVHDAANPAEVMRDVLAFATAAHPPEERDEVARALQAGAHDWAVHNFSSGCEVGEMLLRRLDFGPGVREALSHTFERWNGNGFPAGSRGDEIPVVMRVVHLTHDMEALARLYSPDVALQAARDRSGSTYDPELVDLFVVQAPDWFDRLLKIEPWDAVLALEPAPHRTFRGAELDDALLVLADFIDLKSPYMAGHSRRCADLGAQAARRLGFSAADVERVHRAALVHEFGTTAVPNSIWDKSGQLTRAEFDRVELHPMLTEQMLRRSPSLAALNPVAAAHHEKLDGSGYHKRVTDSVADPGSWVLAATDVYVGLTTDRADRPAFSDQYAATELRRLAAERALPLAATEAVLTAAGHTSPGGRTARQPHPAGLTRREVEVLRLAARGLTTREIADQLYISAKTADHHIQNVYAKIGVSSRAAACLWAMQHSVLG